MALKIVSESGSSIGGGGGKQGTKDELEVAVGRHDNSLKINNLQVEKDAKDDIFEFPGEVPIDAATENLS